MPDQAMLFDLHSWPLASSPAGTMQAGAGRAGGLTDVMRAQLEKAVAISPKQRQGSSFDDRSRCRGEERPGGQVSAGGHAKYFFLFLFPFPFFLLLRALPAKH